MPNAPDSLVRDPARLDALRATGLLDSDAEPAFDRLTRLVAGLLKVPVALVSLVDTDRQFFKSAVGLPEPWATARQTPLSHSFCQHVVATGKTLTVEDAPADPLVHDNGAVPDLGVIAYLGVPLTDREGHHLGALCAIDSRPRAWTEAEREALTVLAAAVCDEIAQRRELAESRERSRELAAQAEELRRLVGLLDLAFEPIVLRDLDGTVRFWNVGAERLYGWPRREAVGRTVATLLRPELPCPAAEAAALLQREGHWEGETVNVTREGRRLLIESRWSLRRDESGQPKAVLELHRDVTEGRRERTERAERARLAELRGEVGLTLTRRGPLVETLTRVADQLRRGLGLALLRLWLTDESDGELLPTARAAEDGFPDDDPGPVAPTRRAVQRVARDRVPFVTDDLGGSPDVEDRVWARRHGLAGFAAYPLVVEERLVGVLGGCSRQPLTAAARETLASLADAVALYIERKHAERDLSRSQARKAAILASALDSIITIDHLGRIQEFNPAAERTFGFEAGEAVGRPLAELIIPPAYREAHARGLQRYLETGEGPVLGKRIEISARRADGAEFPVELEIIAVHHDGPPVFTAYLRDITERRRSEDSLRAAAERLDLALRGADLGLWDWNIETSQVLYNERWAAMLGYELDELMSDVPAWEQMVHPDDRERVSAALRDHLEGKTPFYESEHRMRAKSGPWVWVLDRGRVVARGADGRPLRATGTHLDITARKRAEEAIRESQSMLALAEQLTHAGSFLWDPASKRLDWSDELYRIHGRSPSGPRVSLREAVRSVHPDDRDRVVAEVRGVLEGAVRFLETEARIQRADGEVRQVLIRCAPDGASGGRTALVGTVMDVTERRRSEALLRDREARLRSVVETAVDGIIVLDERGTIESANPAAEKLFGSPEEELIGRQVGTLMREGDGEDERLALVRDLAGWSGRTLGRRREVIARRKGGEDLPVELSLSEMQIGDAVKFTGIIRDVTQRRRDEESVRASNALLEAIRHAQQDFIVEAHPSKAFDGMLAALLGLSGSAYGFIGEVLRDPDGTPYLKTHAMTNIAWDDATRELYAEHAANGLEFRNLRTLFGAVLTTAEPLIANDPKRDPRRGGLPAGHPSLDSFLGLPVKRADDLVGMIGLANRPGGFGPDLVEYLQPLVTTCASLLEGCRHDRQRQQVELDLQASKDAADAANRAKSDFLANMSHELRTPLTAVLGFADLLLLPGLSRPERDQALQAIRRNGLHLKQLIDDVLDLSKIEAGKMEAERIAYPPWRVMLEVVSLLRVRADEKQIVLNARADGLVPKSVMLDPIRVRQIVVNFVSNAVKFTDPGRSVTLRLYAEPPAPGAEGAGFVCFEVGDEGIGMSEEQLRHVFRPFQQADTSTTRRYGGTGLGLSISQRLAEVLGGEILARSRPGQGSTFTARLPIVPVGDAVDWIPATDLTADLSRSDLTPAQPVSTASPLCGRVLVAEDSPDLQKLLAYQLTEAGLQVDVAANGAAAVDQALRVPYDVVLMDMQMPVLDGYGATSSLRLAGYERPIIALTAHALSEDRERCLRLGCTEYLTKPVQTAVLLDTIRRHLPPREDVTVVGAAPVTPGPAEDPQLRKLLVSYVGRLGDCVRDLREAAAHGRRDVLRQVAHQVRGTGGMYGFPELSETAGLIEQAVVESRDADLIAELVEEFGGVVAAVRRAVLGADTDREAAP